MKRQAEPEPPAPDREAEAEDVGLPWFRSWRRVYLFVLGCFVLYLLFLTCLTRAFS